MKTIKEIRDEVLKQQQDRRSQLIQELTEKLPKPIADAVLLNNVTTDYIKLFMPPEYLNRLAVIAGDELTGIFKEAFKNAVGAEISSIEWENFSNYVVVKPATSFEI